MGFLCFKLKNQYLLAIVLKLPLYACNTSLAASQNIAVQVFSCFAYVVENTKHAIYIHRGHIS